MSSVVNVAIHESQSPENVQRDLLASLHTRRVNHKFHYDSIKQTNQWLALHQVYSPSRNDRDCAATYDRAFTESVAQIRSKQVHVVGLGCGGGQKDTRLLKQLCARNVRISYTPSDVSVAMTLVAHKAARTVLPLNRIFPFVCDLATAKDLTTVLATHHAPRTTRLVTFFGMIPNFEPDAILPKLATLIRRQDRLLFSANLAPGPDYAAGVKKIQPQYDNALMREWLVTLLRDLGVAPKDGIVRFTVENGRLGLKRVMARYHFRRRRQITVANQKFNFKSGEVVQLFFSYRYTPELVRARLAAHGLKVQQQWLTKSGEEGVFLVRRA
jgi:L-histidine N-alpha-methyltransferase